MSTSLAPPQGLRRHLYTDRMKALAACALAQKVGYLLAEDLPGSAIFDTLPTRSFNPHRIIRGKHELFLVKNGPVEIWHTRHDKLVKTLESGALFGELPMLGQTMLGTRAITGSSGATVAVMDEAAALEWVRANPTDILRIVGPRLAKVEAEHYRSRFQLADSRIAALLLELARGDLTVEGVTHQKIGEQLGLHRETVTVVLDAMKIDKLIEAGRMKVTILDKRALRELSEM